MGTHTSPVGARVGVRERRAHISGCGALVRYAHVGLKAKASTVPGKPGFRQKAPSRMAGSRLLNASVHGWARDFACRLLFGFALLRRQNGSILSFQRSGATSWGPLGAQPWQQVKLDPVSQFQNCILCDGWEEFAVTMLSL